MWEAVISGLFGLKTTLKGSPSNHSLTLIMASRVMFTIAAITLVAAVPRPGILSRDTSTVPTNDNSALVSLSSFPACASRAHSCNLRPLDTPARLGCWQPNLTTDCPSCCLPRHPPSCSPIEPLRPKPCWFDPEQWFSGVCPSVQDDRPQSNARLHVRLHDRDDTTDRMSGPTRLQECDVELLLRAQGRCRQKIQQRHF